VQPAQEKGWRRRKSLPAKQYPLGESNPTPLSALYQISCDDATMPGGAKSGATLDETVEFSHSAAAGTRASLLQVIRLLTEMAADDRAALIDFLKTWG